jgi:hypothetical protein
MLVKFIGRTTGKMILVKSRKNKVYSRNDAKIA